ncbi:uncharacterized protein LOC131143958 [Malania oleifera]|uniref:uncharacterized protein LOC131143958 n=1 Tax=Malania oleifera TaxID=397392 RepID=UPI0025AE2BE3|nr:uncharacterized protein LOC131143958 [Malania oleifera]
MEMESRVSLPMWVAVVVRVSAPRPFTRLKPSAFVGSTDPVSAENWIQEIEKILDVLKCTERQKVTFTTFKLAREAERWWVSKCENRGIHEFDTGIVNSAADFATLVDKVTVAEECLLEDAEVQVTKKRPAPPNFSFGTGQGKWKKKSGGTSQNSVRVPRCSLCSKKHHGQCWLSTRACMQCGRKRHQMRDCQMQRNSGAS